MATHNALLRALALAITERLPGQPPQAEIVATPELATEVWEHWSEERTPAQRQDDLHDLARASAQDVRTQIVAHLPPVKNVTVTDNPVAEYLAGVPHAIRRSLDAPVMTVTDGGPGILHPDQLLALLPARTPHFKAGDRPIPGVDLELVELLGVGGFGEVWKAHNPHFDGVPPAALKFCRDPMARDRMLRHEAAVLNQVMRNGSHPGIVPLLRTYMNSDPPCLEYEYIEGGDLTGLVRKWAGENGRLAPDVAARITGQLAETVGFMHRLDPPIVHRDLKPANVLVQQGAGGRVTLRIADFGIGGLAARHAIHETARCGPNQGQFLTSALRGAFTPLYASPQQARGDEPDPRDDVYALGVIWYQLLTGDLAAGRPVGRHWAKELKAANVSAAQVDLLGTCFEDDAAGRPADAAALAEAIATTLRRAAPAATRPADDVADLAGQVQDTLQEVTRAHRSARNLIDEEQDYAGAARLLEAVPEYLRDAAFFESLCQTRDRIAGLGHEIAEAVRHKQFAGLREKVGALLELQPRRDDLRKLMDVLLTKADLPRLLTNSVGMRLALIPAGSFRMGSPKTEAGGNDRERPDHAVTLSRPFYLGVYPVTQRQYVQVMDVNPSCFSPDNRGSLDHPVEQVSWDDATEFCRRLSAMPAEKAAWRQYRLPTEAEWEYACRAGTTTPFSGGAALAGNLANIRDDGQPGDNAVTHYLRRTSKVGSYPPNAFGLFDMHGNVWEWCQDRFGADYYARSPAADPPGPDHGEFRVLRGGSWYTRAWSCRAAFRNMGSPVQRLNHAGFRVLLGQGIKTG